MRASPVGRALLAWPALLAAGLTCASVAPAAARTAVAPGPFPPVSAQGFDRPDGRVVRAFAVGPRLDIRWLETAQGFRFKQRALFDRRLRGAGAPLVQDAADDVASHLRGPDDPARPVQTARDFVAFPEDAGLYAAFTGPRGVAARASPSLNAAFVSLGAGYAPQIAYYTAKHPSLASRVPPGRALVLGLTDVFMRVAVETYARLADDYDVWLHAGVSMAREWQVVCDDRRAFDARAPVPGGVRCAEENPAKVDLLGDPSDPRDYAYEATSSEASVMALVFDPDGRLVSKQLKTYLTPLELGPDEDQIGLDLAPGEVSDGLGVVETPVGTLGFVTSKDAWMPDVLQKLDQRHVDLLVQPEYFVGNNVRSTDMWNPDVLLASGYMDVLRHPSIEVLVLPELVGNVGDVSADHQQAIAIKPRRAGPGAGFVGQPEHRGLMVSDWLVPDPTAATVAARRAALASAGEAGATGSGAACPDGEGGARRAGPCEGGQVEGVLWRDIRVHRRPGLRPHRGRRAQTRFSRSRPLSRSRFAQRNVALARRGRLAVVAWEERRGRRDQVFLARSRDGGRTWSRPVRPTGRPRGLTEEWWPAVAIGEDGAVTVAWVDLSDQGRERAYIARSTDGGSSFSPPRPLDGGVLSGSRQWRPSLAAGREDVVHAAYVDERGTFEGGGTQATLRYARVRGGVPGPSVRLDSGAVAALAAKLDNAWAPSVAADGDYVLVAWLDFLRYDWDVFARASEDGGVTFGPQRTVNDTPDDLPSEALNDSPQAVLTPSGPLVAWTDWRKRHETPLAPHQAYDTFIAAPGSENVQVDPYGGQQVSTFSPSACSIADDVFVAFQDASAGQNDIRIARMAGGRTLTGTGERRAAVRVDDGGAAMGNAWRPQIACERGYVLAAWEDERDGPPQVYVGRAAARRLP